MTSMEGPSDEIGPPLEPIEFVSESGVNEAKVGEHIVAQREDGRLIFGKVVEIVPQDTPVEGQEHLEAPRPYRCESGHLFAFGHAGCLRCGVPNQEIGEQRVPIGYEKDGLVYVGLGPHGKPIWHPAVHPQADFVGEADPELADLIPRQKPRRTVKDMMAEDARREAEAAAERQRQRQLVASQKIADRLEVYMHHLIFGKGRYDYHEAPQVLEDVLAALRGEVPHRPELDVQAALREAWSDGFDEGADYLSSCCGCSGKGEPPANPYGEEG